MSGVAPIRSPADTNTEFGFVARSWRTCVARYSTPPARKHVGATQTPGAGPVRAPILPPEPVGGSRLPWKSFRPRIWISVVCAFSTALGEGPSAAFADAALPAGACACSAALADGPASACTDVPLAAEMCACSAAFAEGPRSPFAGGPLFATASGTTAIATASAATAISVFFICPLLLRLRIQKQPRLEHESVSCRRRDEPGRLAPHLADEGPELGVARLRHAVEVVLELRARVVAGDHAVLAVEREQRLEPSERRLQSEPRRHRIVIREAAGSVAGIIGGEVRVDVRDPRLDELLEQVVRHELAVERLRLADEDIRVGRLRNLRDERLPQVLEPLVVERAELVARWNERVVR